MRGRMAGTARVLAFRIPLPPLLRFMPGWMIDDQPGAVGPSATRKLPKTTRSPR